MGDDETKTDFYDGDNIAYDNRVVSSTHMPASGDHVIRIGADRFKNRNVQQTPIDGYGMPKIHLSLLRMVCTNGAVAYTRAFRTEINTGKDPAYSVGRALDTYDNDNGYAALWQRFESAQNSWASLRETQQLYSLLVDLESGRALTHEGILNRFYEMTGRPHELCGVLWPTNVKRNELRLSFVAFVIRCPFSPPTIRGHHANCFELVLAEQTCIPAG